MNITLDELEDHKAEGSLVRAVLQVHGWAYPFSLPFKMSTVTVKAATVEQLLWVLYKFKKHDELIDFCEYASSSELTGDGFDAEDAVDVKTVSVYNVAKVLYRQGVVNTADNERDAKAFEFGVRNALGHIFTKLEK